MPVDSVSWTVTPLNFFDNDAASDALFEMQNAVQSDFNERSYSDASANNRRRSVRTIDIRLPPVTVPNSRATDVCTLIRVADLSDRIDHSNLNGITSDGHRGKQHVIRIQPLIRTAELDKKDTSSVRHALLARNANLPANHPPRSNQNSADFDLTTQNAAVSTVSSRVNLPVASRGSHARPKGGKKERKLIQQDAKSSLDHVRFMGVRLCIPGGLWA